jgi:signal transduction histidine kinase
MTAVETRADERRRRSLALDILIAVAAFVVAELFGGPGPRSVGGVALTAVASGLLVWRRSAPVLVLGGTLAVEIVIAVLGVGEHGIAPAIALYTTAVGCERRVSIAALVPTAIGYFAATLAAAGSDAFFRAIANALLLIGVWVLGAYIQTRRRYLRELRDRAAYLEREREQLARIAVIEERTSIARELHDIVAHSVSVMLVAVRGARDVLRTSPQVADDTLARVEASGEQSLAELRRILTLLRRSEQSAQSRPQPSIADIDGLIAEHRAGGLPVELQIVGEPRPLTDGDGLTVYRIVQEALTNVVKHCEPSRVTVTLSFRDGGLDVEVLDDGIPAAAGMAGAGHGILGMRERVALLGGELETGPRAGGGFRVAASLPIGGPA